MNIGVSGEVFVLIAHFTAEFPFDRPNIIRVIPDKMPQHGSRLSREDNLRQFSERALLSMHVFIRIAQIFNHDLWKCQYLAHVSRSQ
jgi:hypothetical protein